MRSLILPLWASVWLLAQAAQTPPTFRAQANSVSIDVAVMLRQRPVTGLTADDFELFDNGVPQRIASLAFGDVPIDLTLALDTSGSVQGSVLDLLRRSIHELVGDLTPRDRFRLVSFDSRIVRLVEFGEPPAAIDRAFDTIRPAGGTTLRDMMAVALATPPVPDRRQLVVVFSDGDDQSSVTSLDTLMGVAKRTAPTLGFVVAESTSAASQRAVSTYEPIVKETGGFIETAGTDKSLGGTFRKVLGDFRRSYVLYFTPAGVTPGGQHSLDVKVKRAGVEVRARRSYTAR